jgi:TRAP-type C4-dicarboxylate transport system substrate-binding protein
MDTMRRLHAATPWRTGLGFALAALCLLASGSNPQEAEAQEGDTITLRIATLAPRGSGWMRVFNAWNNSLREATDERLRIRFYPGGSQGDERDVVRKIRIGQLDGAAVTSTGLGLIVPSVLVLQAPGVINTYRQVDRARTALADQFDREFESQGVHLLGWGDVGLGRIFSNRAIERPQDLRQVRPWVWTDDQMFSTMLSVVGANGVRLGVPEVLPGLSTGQIDTVVASATAASALQWHTRLTHVTEQANSVLVGATIMSQERFASLPPDLQQALTETSERAHTALRRRIRRDDARYYTALTTQQGLTAVDTSAHQAEWDRVAEQTRGRLAGRVFPQSLLQQVIAAVR